MSPRVTLQAPPDKKEKIRIGKLSASKEKLAARRGTMMPIKMMKKGPKKPRSTFKNVYRWWEKEPIKYA